MSGSARALLYLAADPERRPRLLAALELDPADGSSRLLPDATRISERDPRGRRSRLGALLAPHSASTEGELADVAAHLLPLPELGGTPSPATVELRLIGLDSEAFGRSWPAAGGGEVAVRSAPFQLPGDREGALLASRGAPHGPWLRPIGALSAEADALLRLVAELGLNYSGPGLLEPWIDGAVEGGSAGDVGARCLEAFRELVRETMLGGEAAPREVAGMGLAVRLDAEGETLRWRFELGEEHGDRTLDHATARFAPEAIAELLAVIDGHLQPWWLMVFDAVAGLGPTFVGLVDLRRYLVENLGALEGLPS